MRKKNYQCLMIETPDHRKFFTHEKNYIQLVEFANTFDAQVSLVKVSEADVLELAPLAAAISDASYDSASEFEIIETRIPASISLKRPRGGSEIKDHVKKLFLSEQPVVLWDILNEFKGKISYSSLSTTLHKIRKELSEEGHEIVKIGAGRYQIAKKRED